MFLKFELLPHVEIGVVLLYNIRNIPLYWIKCLDQQLQHVILMKEQGFQ